MQRLIYLIIFFIVAHLGSAQTIKGTLNALNNRDFESLSTYLDSEIELCLNDAPQNIKKAAAIKKLKNFFVESGISKIVLRHSGSNSLNNSGFKILSLTGSASKYRMFIYTEKTSNGSLIQEIRLDKQ